MAVGDIVTPRITVNSNPATLQQQPPHFGIIDVETLPALSVLWDNLIVAALTGLAALADANLDVVSAPSVATSSFFGRWVRRVVNPNAATLDPSGGASREFDGKVIAAYGRRPLETPLAPVVDFLLVVNDDGVYFEDVATRWVIDPNR